MSDSSTPLGATVTPAAPDGFVMPDFGHVDAPHAATETSPEAALGVPAGPRKMAFICSKGNLDMAYPALIMGNAALGEGIEVHIFFTFWGLDIINRRTNADLKFTMTGNTAMHMPQLGRVHDGLEHRSLPQGLGNLPGMTGMATRMMKRQMEEMDIPTVPEFLDLLQASGAHMYACRLTFEMNKIIEADLHPGVERVLSASDFIVVTNGAQIIFV